MLGKTALLTITFFLLLGVVGLIYVFSDTPFDMGTEQVETVQDINGYQGQVARIFHNDLGEVVDYPEDVYQISITLENGVLGSTAINSIGGEYTVSNGDITFSEVFSTLIGAENMEWEIMYLEHINNTSSYELDAGVLRFYDAQDNLLVEFSN